MTPAIHSAYELAEAPLSKKAGRTMSFREKARTSPSGLAIAWLAMALMSFWLSITINSFLGLQIVEALPLLVLGLVFVALGSVIRYLALKPLLGSNKSIQWHHVPGTLVEDGVFRYSRNPAYLGVLLMFLGAFLLEVNLPMLVILVVIFTLLNRQASREEETLTKQFGESYRSYRKRARRWL
jgi:protein-S-isoprenylcysteine O-methyltransferase Ste14